MYFCVVVGKSKKGNLFPVLKFSNGRYEFVVTYDKLVICRILNCSLDDLFDRVNNSAENEVFKIFEV